MVEKEKKEKRPVGRPRGKATAHTLEKMAVAAAYNQKILKTADKLFVAQAQLALGSMKVIRVDETQDAKGNIKREHAHVTDSHEIIALLNEHDGLPGEVDGSYYFFVDVAPDNRALDSMLNRGIGKPVEPVEIKTPDVSAIVQEVIASLTEEGYAEPKIRAILAERYPEVSNANN